jgi:hypothetical protein
MLERSPEMCQGGGSIPGLGAGGRGDQSHVGVEGHSFHGTCAGLSCRFEVPATQLGHRKVGRAERLAQGETSEVIEVYCGLLRLLLLEMREAGDPEPIEFLESGRVAIATAMCDEKPQGEPDTTDGCQSARDLHSAAAWSTRSVAPAVRSPT